MNFKTFLTAAKSKGFTFEQLRCDVPVTADLLEFMGEVGMDRYETFMGRLDEMTYEQFLKGGSMPKARRPVYGWKSGDPVSLDCIVEAPKGK